ncbi:MAG TPA: hypothetical protein VMV49_18300 [Candidatus Deferrimicrobium sp.]|nr:hypothetical protein [Candidatus Deferrimicrobium sp.]
MDENIMRGKKLDLNPRTFTCPFINPETMEYLPSNAPIQKPL